MVAPLTVEEWSTRIKPKRARRLATPALLKLAELSLTRQAVGEVQLRRSRRGLELVRATTAPGRLAFPRPVPTVPVTPVMVARTAAGEPSGHRPGHLALRPWPAELPEELVVPRKFRWTELERGARGQDVGEPSTIFQPDDRSTFSDTSFPWGTCGRVDVAGGSGSGVMIGPRHMMTASHVINWGPDNTAGWVRFTPLYFDGNAPFGSASATRIYWWRQVNGADGIDANESAFDFVVCVLDSRLGDITGWMGSRAYSSSWNGGAFWAHVGYPGDLASGQRPAFIGNCVLEQTFAESNGGRSSFSVEHRADVWPGQSGGPFFGWWDNEPWPRAVVTQSAENWGGPGGPNRGGGGDPLPELISHARTAEP